MPVVPTHPVTTPDPDVLRWVVPDGLLPFTGEVAHAPALLQALIDDGTLSSVRVDGGAVLTLLGPGHSWRTEGARVRSALVDALGAPQSWQGAMASSRSPWRAPATTAQPPRSRCTRASSTCCGAAAPGWSRSAGSRSRRNQPSSPRTPSLPSFAESDEAPRPFTAGGAGSL